jgi:cytochrome P450/NADPH-cytochrome P450 reductase
MLMQNFNFQMDDPSYDLRLKQTLTIKPEGFYMRATLRHNLDPTNLSLLLGGTPDLHKDAGATNAERKPKVAPAVGKLKPMHIFYGSNTGTCEAFARRLADDAIGYGYSAEPTSLDSARQNIPKNDPVVFITASYEGQPPDNAAHFFEWLSELKGSSLEGVNYAVFGCGHREYHSHPLKSAFTKTLQMTGLQPSTASPRQ